MMGGVRVLAFGHDDLNNALMLQLLGSRDQSLNKYLADALAPEVVTNVDCIVNDVGVNTSLRMREKSPIQRPCLP